MSDKQGPLSESDLQLKDESAELVFLVPDKQELTHTSILTVNIMTVRNMVEGESTDKFGIIQTVSDNFQQYIMKYLLELGSTFYKKAPDYFNHIVKLDGEPIKSVCDMDQDSIYVLCKTNN